MSSSKFTIDEESLENIMTINYVPLWQPLLVRAWGPGRGSVKAGATALGQGGGQPGRHVGVETREKNRERKKSPWQCSFQIGLKFVGQVTWPMNLVCPSHVSAGRI
jgi:hypothetical protein